LEPDLLHAHEQDPGSLSINEKLLQVVGHSWWSLSVLDLDDFSRLETSYLFGQARDLITTKINEDPDVIFADPTTSLLLPFWAKVFDQLNLEPLYIVLIRHPMAVAKSLTAAMAEPDSDSSLYLWCKYYLSTAYYLVSQQIPFTVFDWDELLASSPKEINRLSRRLSRDIDHAESAAFESVSSGKSLNQHLEIHEAISTSREPLRNALEIYQLLRGVSENHPPGISPSGAQSLQQWHNDLVAKQPLFKLYDRLRLQNLHYQRQAEQIRAELGQAKSQIENLQSEPQEPSKNAIKFPVLGKLHKLRSFASFRSILLGGTSLPEVAAKSAEILPDHLLEEARKNFDPKYYLSQYADVLEARMDPFEHFMIHGWREGRNPSPQFQTLFYWNHSPDVKQAHVNPLLHWLLHGKSEGRLTSPESIARDSDLFFIQPKDLRPDDSQKVRTHDSEQKKEMMAWWNSTARKELMEKAIAIDPEIAFFNLVQATFLPPLFDRDYSRLVEAIGLLPQGKYDCVVLAPCGRMGGADLLTGTLSKALSKHETTIILRTDSPEWDRPSWYGDNVPAINLSGVFKHIESKERALYTLLSILNPVHIFNVNSRLAFETIRMYGRQLAQSSRIHCYYFCSERDIEGRECGYPVHFFRQILPHLTTSLFDSLYLLNTLKNRYSLSDEEAKRLLLFYSPSPKIDLDYLEGSVLVDVQLARKNLRSRPRILWAGRFDRQKRFDLLVSIAQAMPWIDFDAWGKAVLDPPPLISKLPHNLTIHPPYESHAELPLGHADAWLYTSEWDGVPNILIEIGSLGMPVVASGVGGVPELVNGKTGWLVEDYDSKEGYVTAIEKMMASPEMRRERALNLREHVWSQHSQESYARLVTQILKRQS
jgi:glycosyltransferase involved in cell wall biosynthesis